VGCGSRFAADCSPEVQAELDGIAAQQGRDSASLVKEAVERLIGYDEWFIRQVEKGLVQIERGEVLDHDEVAARMEKRVSEPKPRPSRKEIRNTRACRSLMPYLVVYKVASDVLYMARILHGAQDWPR